MLKELFGCNIISVKIHTVISVRSLLDQSYLKCPLVKAEGDRTGLMLK